MMSKVLLLQYWPDTDRNTYTALFAEVGLLDDRGPLAHWRAPSRDAMLYQYGFWLR